MLQLRFQVEGAVLGAPELLPLPFQAAVAGSRGLGTAAVEVPGSGSRIWSSRAAAIAIPGSSSWDEKLGHCCSCGSGTVTGVLTGNSGSSDQKINWGTIWKNDSA